MDPSLRLSCEELLELPYFGEEVASWGRESERPGRRHDKGSRRRQAGVSVKNPVAMDNKSYVCSVLWLHIYFNLLGLLYHLVVAFSTLCLSLGSVLASVTKQQRLPCTRCEETSEA